MVAALIGALAVASVACESTALRALGGAGGTGGMAGHPSDRDAGAGGAVKLGDDASVDRPVDVMVAPLDASSTGGQGGSSVGDGGSGRGFCGQDADCLSGHCTDGVCCNTACSGACVSCALPGRLGTCSPVSAGVTCAAASSCSGTLWSGTGTCDGTGTCQRETRLCLPYACDPQTNACHNACATADDCGPGEPCVNGSCGILEPGACSADVECATGFCAQGACCTTKCDDPCSSCALPGTLGICTPVPNAPDGGACAS